MRRGAAVVVGLALSNLIAATALILSLALLRQTDLNLAGRQKRTNYAVRTSAYNSCILLDSVIFSFHTPQGRASALKILKYNPSLRNCQVYSQHPTLRAVFPPRPFPPR